MGNRKIELVENEYFHIYNRGNSKQVIFRESADYQRFQALMYLSNSHERFVFRELETDLIYTLAGGQALVRIEAYCLMPNHFHILLTPVIPAGASQFMKKLSTAYSMYFNKKYERSGSLFEGPFKSQHADTDEYLKYLFAYIHLNPVKLRQPLWREEGIKNLEQAFTFLRDYSFSSYPDLSIGETYEKRAESAILNSDLFSSYYSGSVHVDHKKDLLEWLTLEDPLAP